MFAPERNLRFRYEQVVWVLVVGDSYEFIELVGCYRSRDEVVPAHECPHLRIEIWAHGFVKQEFGVGRPPSYRLFELVVCLRKTNSCIKELTIRAPELMPKVEKTNPGPRLLSG